MSTRHRALVIAHGHPDFSLGGGELAAFNLFKGLREIPDVEETWFLARVGGQATGEIRPRRNNEYLWQQTLGNHFLFQANNPRTSLKRFKEFIGFCKPTVVFLHHIVHLGIEMISAIKQENPNTKIVLTLHEMLPICLSDGQMVKRGSLRLCNEESLDDCNTCFPEHSRENFWLRKTFIQDHFSMVDCFITPSEFLKERYISWGLPGDKIRVIENGQPPRTKLSPRVLGRDETRNRFGFFGQINPYKGLDIILEAINLLDKEERRLISLEIHGANLEYQTDVFRAKIEKLRDPLIKQGIVQWVGPYRPQELEQRMANIDWVLMPSVWWENSPMIIQEAFGYGRPVICSNIGGMAEKVKNGINGIHVEYGNRHAWANAFLKTSKENGLWNKLTSAFRVPMSWELCAATYLKASSSIINAQVLETV